MIQINDGSFNNVFKRDASMDNKKYAGGVIYANSNEEALKIAKLLVKDIQDRINTEAATGLSFFISKKEEEKKESLLEKYKEEEKKESLLEKYKEEKK